MKILDPGHVYELTQLGGGTQTITFVKRSGGAIQYEKEWPGLQTQEVLRALIDRTKYLDSVLPCVETKEAIQNLRLALYFYELRAWRRKQQKVNQKSPVHGEIGTPSFTEEDIELRPIGEDGHVIIEL
jgi:hypothetical protein